MAPEFCTLFDSNYLPRGLVLYSSLRRVEPRAHLRVFCMDDRAYQVLRQLDLDGLTPVPLDELERHDPQLAAVKADRTSVEYCWTATPCVARYCLEREPDLEAITYVDADLCFFSTPEPLFAELGDNSTQIVPHRYSPDRRGFTETSGIYNVQWLTFKRDSPGLETLGWWRERCLEWCYSRIEDGKFGDQKYLDDWPVRFEGVNVLQHIGGGVAPWNAGNYAIHERDGSLWVDDVPLIFYHFHSLRLFRPSVRYFSGQIATGLRSSASTGLLWTSTHRPSPAEERLVWEPYLTALVEATDLVRTVDPSFDDGFVGPRNLAQQSVRRVLVRARLSARRRIGVLRGQPA